MGLWLGLGPARPAHVTRRLRAPPTYPEIGASLIEPFPRGYRRLDQSDVVGHGRESFEGLATALLRWDLQRRAGLQVSATSPVVVPGTTVVNALPAGPVHLLVPCRVVYVLVESRRRGFGYGTLPGHPLTGEERFTVELRDDDAVVLRITSFSRATGRVVGRPAHARRTGHREPPLHRGGPPVGRRRGARDHGAVTAHAVVTQVVPASVEETFDLIHDYPSRLQWDTLLRRAETVGGEASGPGVEAICSARWSLGGLSFRTRYVTFHRPGLAAVSLVNRPPFFTTWAASIRHRPLDSGHSEVTYTLTFRCRPAFLARVVEPVALAAFRWETSRRLRALAAYLERPRTGA